MASNQPFYEFRTDREARLVRAILRGQWTLDQQERYDADRTALLAKTRWKSGGFDYLVDLRETGVQTMEVAAAARENMAQMPIIPRRFAIIVPSTLTKFQAGRVSEHDDRRFFTDEPSALAWLATG